MMRFLRPCNKKLIGVSFGIVCVVIIGLVLLLSYSQDPPPGFAEVISRVDYPETMQYPHMEDFVDENGQIDYPAFLIEFQKFDQVCGWRSRHTIENLDTLDTFFSSCAEEFLSDTGNENCVMSPLSLYFALDVLAETTSGTSRQQILNLLGMNDIEDLREQASLIWENNYRNNGLSTNLLANALWIDDALAFRQEALTSVAENCHASVYRVQMGSDAANTAYGNWLKERTNGLLSEQVDRRVLSSGNHFVITSTLYFFSNWAETFEEENTTQGTFYGTKKAIPCDFMNQRICGDYYWGDNFTAVCQNLNDYHYFLYVLPNEDCSVDDLLSDPEYLRFIEQYPNWDNQTGAIVNLSVPKFDLSSNLDLTEGLQKMGITDVFQKKNADFSQITSSPMAVTEFKQSVRLMIDETGCTAGAVTVIAAGGGGPREEVDFVLDRPFLFMVTNADLLPLFMGVVKNPTS